MEALNQDLAAIDFWSLKWHMRLIPKKMKSMEISQSRSIAPCYGDLTLCGADPEKVKTLRILGVALDSKLTFKTCSGEVVSKTAKSLGVMRRAGKLFDCPRVLKSCINVYILSSLEYWAPFWCRRRSLIWVCWIVLSTVPKGCLNVSLVVWGTDGRPVPCVCSIRFITEWTTPWMTTWIILLQLVILELQLL